MAISLGQAFIQLTVDSAKMTPADATEEQKAAEAARTMEKFVHLRGAERAKQIADAAARGHPPSRARAVRQKPGPRQPC